MDLRITRSLELAASLKQTLAEYAKKEDQLTRDIGGKRYATNRKYRDIVEQIKTKLAADLLEEESRFQEEENRVVKRFEGRRSRSQRAHDTRLRTLPNDARET